MKQVFTLMLLVVINYYCAQLPAYAPTNGLKAFWTFCNNPSDVSGNGNNGTVSGALLTTDRFNVAGNAYSFNGTSDYISTTMTGILGNNARAVSFWAKTTESVSSLCGVSWGFEQPMPNGGVRYECGFNGGVSNNVAIIGSDCAVSYSTPASISDNAWHHYIFQFAGGSGATINQVQIYQDAVLLTYTVYTYNSTAVLNTLNNWPVNFGRIPYSIPHFFKGSLDDIGIWDRVLTLAEIQQLYYGLGSCNIITAVLNEPVIENKNEYVYPNPNNGTFTIKTSVAVNVTVNNALGQTIYSTILTENSNIEIGDLAEGIYVVISKTEHGTWQNKIVVSK